LKKKLENDSDCLNTNKTLKMSLKSLAISVFTNLDLSILYRIRFQTYKQGL